MRFPIQVIYIPSLLALALSALPSIPHTRLDKFCECYWVQHVNGLFYYFQNNSSGGSQQFVSFNPSTNTYTTLHQHNNRCCNKGCVSFNGTGYYCLDVNSNLCFYNILTNTWVLACSTFTDQFVIMSVPRLLRIQR